ncbi:phosphate ABC transporter permease PstA [Ammoniphilus sp. CFH 90114]|uniref:phosphate ABC transporter permease PstA n=1 Tax=Ammoniphilus sp. CFH 90114 TaxID=2493665 RepID=UPI00100E4AAE|nr:phosphate ABC transporter permease PstA [Ammoniphilus sp. CFH 90114]RXT04768.1 phosphate ABC transporter permease PstA [Ammoniphilus sp. CFH 90114]
MKSSFTAENKQIEARKRKDKGYKLLFLSATMFGVIVLAILILDVLQKGSGAINMNFLSNFPSRFAEKAGLKSALFGTLWMIGLTAPMAFILGVGTALYLEEYAKKNWLTRLIQTNISNLAGVPSIVYGLLGLTIFVRMFSLDGSVMAGALTMTLLILPVIIVASQEALRSVSDSLRHASFALGATKWQTILRVILPSALPGIITGNILALSRAIGETAPLVVVGAAAFIAFTPQSPMDPFTVLPIQIYNWVSRPQEAFHALAAGGIIVLLVVLLSMNAVAVMIRNKFQKKMD